MPSPARSPQDFPSFPGSIKMTYYLLIDIVLIYETLGIILKKGTGDNHQIFLSLSINGHNRQAVLILYKIFIIQEGNMTKKTDRRIRKTKAQLRQGLAELLQEKSLKEITVKELTDKVDINRSTFYLHYSDIYDMMEKIENELIEEIEELVRTRPVNPFNESSFPFIEEIFTILAENRQICAALLGPNGDIAFLQRIENILSRHSLKVLEETLPEKKQDLQYLYSFFAFGCVGMIKMWLTGRYGESPQYMARLTFHLIMNALHKS